MIKKAKFKNIEVFAFPCRQVFLDYIKSKQKILVAINALKIIIEDQKLHRIINENIAYADGVGAVIALRRKGFNAVKIPGSEFWLDIVEKYYNEKSFYLVGGSQHVIEKTINKLKKEYPTIKIVGYRNGFLKEGDKNRLVAELKNKKPDIVFVAQGSPRQEYLMDELIKMHPALYMGLGGSLDVFCGLKKRAPQLFLNSDLEFLYRLMKEPWRFRRQSYLIKFYVLLKLDRL